MTWRRPLLGAVAGLLLLAPPAPADHAWAPVLTIDAESAKTLIDGGHAVAPVDLRAEPDFRAGRLPRARSLPLASLRDRLDEIPRHGVVVLYCACPRDDLFAAYQFLRGRRYANVYVLDGGLEAWRQLGYALER